MIRSILAITGCFFIFASTGLGAAQQDASGIRWMTDKKKAFDEARKTGKPLWVLFR